MLRGWGGHLGIGRARRFQLKYPLCKRKVFLSLTIFNCLVHIERVGEKEER